MQNDSRQETDDCAAECAKGEDDYDAGITTIREGTFINHPIDPSSRGEFVSI